MREDTRFDFGVITVGWGTTIAVCHFAAFSKGSLLTQH